MILSSIDETIKILYNKLVITSRIQYKKYNIFRMSKPQYYDEFHELIVNITKIINKSRLEPK